MMKVLVDSWDESELNEDYCGYRNLRTYLNGNYQSFIATTTTRCLIGKVEIELAEGATVEFYENGWIKSCVLAAPVVLPIFGVPAIIQEGAPLEFSENGEILRFTLKARPKGLLFWKKRNWHYRGRTYQPGMVIDLSTDGDIRSI